MKKFSLVFGILTFLTVASCTKVRPPVDNEFLNESKVRGLGTQPTTFPREPGSVDPEKLQVASGCVDAMQNFMNYIFSPSPNLFFNEIAKGQWLSKDLRSASANHLNSYYGEAATEPGPPTFPDNSTYIGAWEAPTSYAITGGSDTTIEIRYLWRGTMNYDGTTRDVVFHFVDEDGRCKIHDLHHREAEFSREYWLKDSLWKNTYE